MVNEMEKKSNQKRWVRVSVSSPIPRHSREDGNLDINKEIPEEIISIISNRLGKEGSQAEVLDFLNPDYGKILDPFLLSDMKKAVGRIVEALGKNEKIVVYGDYDVDGVTSSALLHDLFQKLNANFEIYIPSRHDEGYGLNFEAVKNLAEGGAKLIITVDCGIKSMEEAKLAKELGIDLIITDHHEVSTELGEGVLSKESQISNLKSRDLLPDALAVINPKRQDNEYPFKDLAGVGVAFKLACAILETLEKRGELGKKYELKKDYSKWLLALVALGTICDVAPLIGENRVLAFYGLKVAQKTKRVGLKALANVSGVDIKNIASHNMGFHLGPRLNASGRLEHAKISYELLVSQDEEQVKVMAEKLNEINIERRDITARIIEEARTALKGKEDERIILLKNIDWPAGVVGIVASRLVEDCGKPVIIFEEGESESKGSARSVGNFDIVEALKKCEEYLVKYGGHKKAAGLTVKNEHFIVLNDKLIKIANEEISEEDLIPEICYDTELELSRIDEEFYFYLLKLEPFGFGNKTPLFRIDNLWVESFRLVGKDANHLKLTLSDSKKRIEAMQFNAGTEVDLKNGDILDVIASISLNEWNGRRSLELSVVDFRKA